MGDLLRTFNYPRNAFASTAAESAQKAHDVIQRVRAGVLLSKDEPFNDSKTFLGTVGRLDKSPVVTRLGELFEDQFLRDPVDAWRWLVTRAMWRYSFPNGTNTDCNKAAQELHASFNFFDLVVRTCWLLSAEALGRSTLYFDELLPILDDDLSWGRGHAEIYQLLLDNRVETGFAGFSERRALLGDLEEEYGCGRDNMNTVFRKAFGQSGLLQLVPRDGLLIGIRIAGRVAENAALWRRLRFVLDHPVRFDREVALTND